MDKRVHDLFAARESSDREKSYRAYIELIELTEKPVRWAYDVWDQMVDDLSHRDGHKRAFASQMLSHLAISDPEGRILRDFSCVAAVMKDEKTVTARHTLQALWKIGLAGPRQKALVVDALETRFRECIGEKNASLVRTDLITAMGRLASAVEDPHIEARAEALIVSEQDERARKKQRICLRKALGQAGREP